MSATTPALATPTAQTQIPTGTKLWAAAFIDSQTGWVIGGQRNTNGVVLRTTDGGRSWATIASLDIFPAGGPNQLRFVDARNGWLLTSVLLPGNVSGCAPPSTAPPECRTVIFRTDDGGQTWRQQLSVEVPSKLGAGLRGLSAVDDRHAWAVRLATQPNRACGPFNCNLEVVATTDGDRWNSVGTLPAFADQLDFIDARTGWATTYTAKNDPGQPTNTATLLVTHDGGLTWTPQLTIDGPGPSLQIDFIDAQIGWALGSDTRDCAGLPCPSYSLYHTTDGGRSWTKLQDGTAPTPWWDPRNIVTVIGGPRFGSGSLGWIPILYDGNASDGVLRTEDGGQTWNRVSLATPSDTWDIHDLAVFGLYAWVVGERIGDEAWFVARSDAGSSWTYQLSISP